MQKTALFIYSSNSYYQMVKVSYCQPPFGILIKERSFSSDIYRFGFNGKEKDNEISGEGNIIAFEARIYDARLCRFFSCDPLEIDYPWQSTFIFAANCPVSLIDYLGMSAGVATYDDEGKSENSSPSKGSDNQNLNDISLNSLYGKLKDEQSNLNLKNDDPKSTCGISIYDVRIVKRLGRLFRFNYWGKGGRERWLEDFICKDERNCGNCPGSFDQGLPGGRPWYMKPKTRRNIRNKAKKIERDNDKGSRESKFVLDIGFRWGNTVFFDFNINSNDNKKFEGGRDHDYFPGRRKANGIHSDAPIQILYRVKDCTKTHLNRIHPLLIGGKRILIPCCTGGVCDDSPDNMDR